MRGGKKRANLQYFETFLYFPQVLQALTSSACQEAFSYERAELLGDGFLKYAVSRRLFLLHPLRHEGQLTGLRQQVVSNSALFQLALAKGLEGLVQADLFNPSKWAAPGLPRTGLVERETVEEGGSGEASGRGGGGGESQGGGTVKGAQPGGRGTSVRPMGSVEEDTGGVRGATPSEVLGRRLDEIRTADGERGAGRATSDGVRTGEEDGADVRHLAESDFPPLGEESSPRTPQQETPPIQGVRALSIGTSSEGSPATGFLRGGDKLGRLVIERAAASPASVLAFEEPANEEAPRGTGRDPPGTRPDNGAVNAWRSEKNDSVHSNPKEVRSQPHSRPAPRGALEVPASANPDPVSAKPRVVNSDGRPEEEVSEAGFGPTDWRVVSDKGLADVVEALIGTYHAEGGVPAAVGLMEWVGIETQVRGSAA